MPPRRPCRPSARMRPSAAGCRRRRWPRRPRLYVTVDDSFYVFLLFVLLYFCGWVPEAEVAEEAASHSTISHRTSRLQPPIFHRTGRLQPLRPSANFRSWPAALSPAVGGRGAAVALPPRRRRRAPPRPRALRGPGGENGVC